MLNILITVYLVVFALMMRKELDDFGDVYTNINKTIDLVKFVAMVLRWLIWPLVSIGQLIYIIVKLVRK